MLSTERAFYYDEKINRLTFIGTYVPWEIIRPTPSNSYNTATTFGAPSTGTTSAAAPKRN